MRGLGDLVAMVAQPVARALHIDSAKCGCAKRQAVLNKWIPFNSRTPTASSPPTSPSALPSDGGGRT